MFGLCAYKHLLHPPTKGEPVKEKTFDSLRMNPFLVSTFKYKKGTENTEAASGTECAVCLTSFEDDERVSQLPQFHDASTLSMHLALTCGPILIPTARSATLPLTD